MAKSSQALWAQNEMFLLLGDLMNPALQEEDLYLKFKKYNGWMVFAKDDTLLSTYLEVCERRLFELSKPLQKKAAKKVLECAKCYKYSKEYLDILKIAQKLIS